MLELGNTLNHDQGLGVFAVSAFVDRLKEKMGADIEVEFVDGGALGGGRISKIANEIGSSIRTFREGMSGEKENKS